MQDCSRGRRRGRPITQSGVASANRPLLPVTTCRRRRHLGPDTPMRAHTAILYLAWVVVSVLAVARAGFGFPARKNRPNLEAFLSSKVSSDLGAKLNFLLQKPNDDTVFADVRDDEKPYLLACQKLVEQRNRGKLWHNSKSNRQDKPEAVAVTAMAGVLGIADKRKIPSGTVKKFLKEGKYNDLIAVYAALHKLGCPPIAVPNIIHGENSNSPFAAGSGFGVNVSNLTASDVVNLTISNFSDNALNVTVNAIGISTKAPILQDNLPSDGTNTCYGPESDCSKETAALSKDPDLELDDHDPNANGTSSSTMVGIAGGAGVVLATGFVWKLLSRNPVPAPLPDSRGPIFESRSAKLALGYALVAGAAAVIGRSSRMARAQSRAHVIQLPESDANDDEDLLTALRIPMWVWSVAAGVALLLGVVISLVIRWRVRRAALRRYQRDQVDRLDALSNKNTYLNLIQ
ncbi:Uncharacterized protein PBTT_07152 [Plasmodiophora brassicae]